MFCFYQLFTYQLVSVCLHELSIVDNCHSVKLKTSSTIDTNANIDFNKEDDKQKDNKSKL
jgi:hypothetical protein